MGTLKCKHTKYAHGEPMPESTILLTDEDRVPLLKVNNPLEEIMETLDIIEDKVTMISIKQAEKDVKEERVRNYNKFLWELKQSGEM